MTTTRAIKYEYCVVVPVYNSAPSIRLLVEKCSVFFGDKSNQIVLVNDGSTDGSWEEIKTIQQDFDNITAIDFHQNAGQHAATFCGFMFSEAEYVITIDDDLQVDPSEIAKLIAKAEAENADVVYGVYEQKKHHAIRNQGSNTVGLLLNKFASTPTIGSSFKLIHHSVIDQVVQHNHVNIYVDELIGWHTKHTAFANVEHQPRAHGKSGYSFFKLLKLTGHLFVNYTALPLKIITYLGIISSLVSFGFAIYFIYMKYTIGASMGFTSLIVAIFFSTGLILLSLGIIGEYLSKIFLLQTGKPPFKINAVLK